MRKTFGVKGISYEAAGVICMEVQLSNPSNCALTALKVDVFLWYKWYAYQSHINEVDLKKIQARFY